MFVPQVQPHLTSFLTSWPGRPLSQRHLASESSTKTRVSAFPSWCPGLDPSSGSSPAVSREHGASPELVIGVLEVLPGKDHSWAGVDRQG